MEQILAQLKVDSDKLQSQKFDARFADWSWISAVRVFLLNLSINICCSVQKTGAISSKHDLWMRDCAWQLLYSGDSEVLLNHLRKDKFWTKQKGHNVAVDIYLKVATCAASRFFNNWSLVGLSKLLLNSPQHWKRVMYLMSPLHWAKCNVWSLVLADEWVEHTVLTTLHGRRDYLRDLPGGWVGGWSWSYKNKEQFASR